MVGSLNMAKGVYDRSKSKPRLKGVRFTEEHRNNLSIAHKGKQSWLGLKHSEEARQKMSIAKKGRKPPNYIVDRSKVAKRQQRNDTAYADWRSSVRNRDNWKCQLADGTCEGKVIAHHILPWRSFPTLRYEIKNGITLCRVHHPRKRDDEIKSAPQLLAIVLAKGNQFGCKS